MEGLSFITETAPVTSDPVRSDIACFIGFVARRTIEPRLTGESDDDYLQRQLPAWLISWLKEQNWVPGWYGRTVEDIVGLSNIPVLIDTWDAFDSLFAWERRPLDSSGNVCDTTLGAAVRSFFAGGGRRCYVVRVGDPWPFLISSTGYSKVSAFKLWAREALKSTVSVPVASERESWLGVGHLFGLPDVSFLSMPDLPEIFSVESWPRKSEIETIVEEHFVEMGSRLEPVTRQPLRNISAPRCDETGFCEWSSFVSLTGDFLRINAREVQLIASVPLPACEMSFAGDPDLPDDSLEKRIQMTAVKVRAARDAQWHETEKIRTAFVQLVYPWIRNRDTARLPGDLAPPDGFLAGLLAANALTRGTWNSIIRQPIKDIDAVEPVLDHAVVEDLPRPRLKDYVTIFGPTAGGMRIQSDVTSDVDESYRPANVSRLMSSLVRAARVIGEQSVFENNGEALWNRLKDRFSDLMAGLWAEGALSGASASDAFEVSCDRSTMTQADLDSGRVIVRVSFTAAMPIVRFVVVFALNDGGQVSLAGKKVEMVS
jgi:hypothetical protein